MKNVIIDDLKDLEFVINGKKFKDGDVVKLNHAYFNLKKAKMESQIVNGVIKFEVYSDYEGYLDEEHLGFLIDIEGYRSGTLPDLFDEIIFE